ncbi:MAG: LysM peptidoglycan-binding domain-containing protein [Nitrospirae bacterium]|nr:LysM peptidoglycan-binding domain-containing protein [Nitrospirota bacterium]MBI3593943.1 LysM peptidoglycan-binding domain-containing protein [Nitrospirota bacterium]
MTIKSYEIKSFLSSLLMILIFCSSGFAEALPGTEYIVKKGDTLWAISSSHYTDPFLWPKLWGKNQAIPHPDKIYPGMKIFLPAEEVLKEMTKTEESPVEVKIEPVAEKPETEPAVLKEEKVTEEKESVPSIQEEAKNGELTESAPLENDSKKGTAWTTSDLLTGGFILKESSESDRKGLIVASENEHLLLGEGDVVYLIPEGSHRFKLGEQYTIFEQVKSIHHPKTRRLMGKLIRIKGVLEIIPNSMASRKDTYSAKIIKSYQLISLKDSVAPYHPMDPINVVIHETPFPKQMYGVVVASKDIKENNGEHDIVYLDKGSQDGVQPGNLFVVFKEGKKAPFYSPSGIESLPRRIIADLEVISVEKESSTAIVSRSLEPVIVGDQISNPPFVNP